MIQTVLCGTKNEIHPHKAAIRLPMPAVNPSATRRLAKQDNVSNANSQKE